MGVRASATVAFVLLVASGSATACGSGLSKSEASELIKRGVTEDGSCTLPVEILGTLKVQHVTKGVCVPKDGADKAKACLAALVTANVTQRMPDAYMLAWPDDVATASFTDVPAYERRARSLVYATCVGLSPGLREGRFACAEARAGKIAKITSRDPTHADVQYERVIALRPELAAIEAACGAVSRPAGNATIALVKGAAGWMLPPKSD